MTRIVVAYPEGSNASIIMSITTIESLEDAKDGDDD